MSHKIHAIEYLTWDSEFFGFPVSRISASVGDSPKIILRKIDGFLSDGDGLCYVVLPLELHRVLSSSLIENGAVHYGSRVSFHLRFGDPNSNLAYSGGVQVIEKMNGYVRTLAIKSGRYSRFFKDELLAGKAAELYARWIENGFTAYNNGNGVVLGVFDDGTLVGIVSVSVIGRTAKVDLLAVEEGYRGRGIGRRLMGSAVMFARERDCDELIVVTQGENVEACGFYASLGMLEYERSEIWHLRRK